MNNPSNHNGKEVIKPKSSGNVQREGAPKHVNKNKRKNVSSNDEVHSGEQKKISINIHKKGDAEDKYKPKGNVVRIEDKGGRIHPVEPREKQSIRPKINKSSSTLNEKTFSTGTMANSPTVNSTKDKIGKMKASNNTGTILLIAALVFFIAWIVIFFYNNIGGNSHMLLGLAIICGVIGVLSNNKNGR